MGQRPLRALALGAALLGVLLGSAAPASAQAGIDRRNQEFQNLWDQMRPGVQKLIFDTAKKSFDNKTIRKGVAEVHLQELQRIRFDASTGFGYTELTPDRVGLRVPVRGHWKIEVEAKVRVKLRLGFLRPSFKIPLKLIVDDLSLQANAAFDRTDPDMPRLRQVSPPKVEFKVKVRSRKIVYGLLFRLLSPLGNRLAHKALDDALKGAIPMLTALQGVPIAIPGDGAPALTDSGTQTPFEEVALNVDRKLRQFHLPHGTLLETYMDQPQTDSWLAAYRNGGTGNQGAITGYTDGGDSAIWTGHYLSSQAFRYSVTGDADALDNIRHAVDGIGKLIDVNGATGLLARVAAPEGTMMGDRVIRDGVFRSAIINGVRWNGRQGGHGISRDQYSGVFMGLSLAYDHVSDAQIKADCALRITQMLDYFIANQWLVKEDRPTFDGTPQAGMPTFWHQTSYQKLAFLLVGERVAPGRYAAALTDAGPLAHTQWFDTWTSTFGLDHYYKFNLAHTAYYTFFRLEHDPTRWQALHRAWRILRRYTGHHRNAHFDLIATSVDPATQAVYFPATRETMRRFLDRNHREVAPPVVDLSNVVYQQVPQMGYTTSGTSGGLVSNTQTLPSEPLDFHQRRYEGNFHWQRTPFTAANPNEGNPRKEKPGIDVTLPYWMGRAFGAF